MNNWVAQLMAGTAGSDFNDWDEMLKKALKMEPVEEVDKESMEFYTVWMASMHFEIMLNLFAMEKKFREQLKDGKSAKINVALLKNFTKRRDQIDLLDEFNGN